MVVALKKDVRLVASPNLTVRNDFPHIHTSTNVARGLAELRVSAKPRANTSFIASTSFLHKQEMARLLGVPYWNSCGAKSFR